MTILRLNMERLRGVVGSDHSVLQPRIFFALPWGCFIEKHHSGSTVYKRNRASKCDFNNQFELIWLKGCANQTANSVDGTNMWQDFCCLKNFTSAQNLQKLGNSELLSQISEHDLQEEIEQTSSRIQQVFKK